MVLLREVVSDGGPSASPSDLDTLYAETTGYAEFVEAREKALTQLATITDDNLTIVHMMTTPELLLESGHTGRWFLLRHTEMMAEKRTSTLKQEVRQFFLFDCACDAANAFFAQRHGGQRNHLATDPMELRSCSLQGVQMLGS